jgi:hypothetical protein
VLTLCLAKKRDNYDGVAVFIVSYGQGLSGLPRALQQTQQYSAAKIRVCRSMGVGDEQDLARDTKQHC